MKRKKGAGNERYKYTVASWDISCLRRGVISNTDYCCKRAGQKTAFMAKVFIQQYGRRGYGEPVGNCKAFRREAGPGICGFGIRAYLKINRKVDGK